MFLSLSSFAIRPQDQEQTTYQKCVKRIKRHSRPKPPRGACIYCLSTLTAANQQEWPIFRAIYGHQNNPPMASFKSDIKGKCTIIPRCCGGGYRNRTGLLGFAIRCIACLPTRLGAAFQYNIIDMCARVGEIKILKCSVFNQN